MRLGEFAEKVGLSASYLSRVFSGQSFCSADICHRIRVASDGCITADDLVDTFLDLPEPVAPIPAAPIVHQQV